MGISLSASFISLWGYIIFYLVIVGLLTSHSYSYYVLKEKGLGWMFPVSLVLSTFTLIPVALELTPEPIKFVAFLSFMPIMFTGVAYNYKDDSAHWTHMASAKCGGIISVIWAVLMAVFVSWWLLVVPIITGVVFYALYRMFPKVYEKIYISEHSYRTEIKSTKISFLEYWAMLNPYIILTLMLTILN